ncbi:MAG TPA: hypothetical protein VMH84_06300 [Xanthobacteraceae bacterium]|nr:hypothetical protein [Xanthobacteraceae bacterium]
MRIQERGFRKRGPEHMAAIGRVRDWTRARFTLAEDTAILVSEVACVLPGCPPLETVIAFWEGGQRYHFKVFKPVAELTADDLPYAWQKESLSVPPDFVCDCC